MKFTVAFSDVFNGEKISILFHALLHDNSYNIVSDSLYMVVVWTRDVYCITAVSIVLLLPLLYYCCIYCITVVPTVYCCPYCFCSYIMSIPDMHVDR